MEVERPDSKDEADLELQQRLLTSLGQPAFQKKLYASIVEFLRDKQNRYRRDAMTLTDELITQLQAAKIQQLCQLDMNMTSVEFWIDYKDLEKFIQFSLKSLYHTIRYCAGDAKTQCGNMDVKDDMPVQITNQQVKELAKMAERWNSAQQMYQDMFDRLWTWSSAKKSPDVLGERIYFQAQLDARLYATKTKPKHHLDSIMCRMTFEPAAPVFFVNFLSLLTTEDQANFIALLPKAVPFHYFNVDSQCASTPATRKYVRNQGTKIIALDPTFEVLEEINQSYLLKETERDKMWRMVQTIDRILQTVRQQGERQYAQTVLVAYQALIENLPGRESFMNGVAGQMLAFAHDWRMFTQTFLNYALLGPPGVGKTTLAVRLKNFYQATHILVQGSYQLHTRGTLVAGYVGQTAPKVRRELIQQIEGIFFLDEAYALAQSQKDVGQALSVDAYGLEAINEIVAFLDQYKGRICMVVAGYECDMHKFWFGMNEGMARRFPFTYTLGRYTNLELFHIFDLQLKHHPLGDGPFLGRADQHLEPAALVYFQTFLIRYRFLLVNEAADAEALAREVWSQTVIEQKPLSLSHLKDILKRWVKNRLKAYVLTSGYPHCQRHTIPTLASQVVVEWDEKVAIPSTTRYEASKREEFDHLMLEDLTTFKHQHGVSDKTTPETAPDADLFAKIQELIQAQTDQFQQFQKLMRQVLEHADERPRKISKSTAQFA